MHDLLLVRGAEPLHMCSARLATRNLHGAGCTLSSAIAAHLALGLGLSDAVQAARHYVQQALAAGATVQTGEGVGPLNHGFAPRTMVTLGRDQITSKDVT